MKKRITLLNIGLFIVLTAQCNTSFALAPANENAKTIAEHIKEEVRVASKSLEYLTLKNIEEKPQMIQPAWEALIEGLKDTSTHVERYRKLAETPESKLIFDEAHNNIKNIQQITVAFLQSLYDEAQKSATPMHQKEILINALAKLGRDWREAPLGTHEVNFEQRANQLATKIKEDESVNTGDEKLHEETAGGRPKKGTGGNVYQPAHDESIDTGDEKIHIEEVGGKHKKATGGNVYKPSAQEIPTADSKAVAEPLTRMIRKPPVRRSVSSAPGGPNPETE